MQSLFISVGLTVVLFLTTTRSSSVYILHGKEYDVSIEGNLEANLGQAIKLTCVSMESSECPKWTFPSENGVIITSQRIEGETEVDVYYVSNLEIKNADFEHEGSYECAVGDGPKNVVEIVIIDPDITCPRFTNSSEINVSYERERRVGSRAFFSCKQLHYQLNGLADVACLNNAEWSGDFPQCTGIKCKKFKENELLSIFYTNDGIVGSRAIFHCPSPRKRSGVAFATCLENGMWSDPAPSCLLHACTDLPIPKAGSVIYLSAQQRSAISRARNTSRVSSRSGTFRAIHRFKRTPALALETSIAEPYMISLHPGSRPVGSKVVVKCESKYYQLFGSRVRRCQETGQWSGKPAICLPVCGRSESTRSPYIINGNATDIGQWPWQAGIALDDYEGWTMACGASLLNELWVITAAHCVTYKNTASIIEPGEFQVYLGKYYRNDTKDDEYVQIRKIQEIHVHPDYNPRTYDADIALIQLDSPVELTYRVQPICLPTALTTRKNLVEGQKGIVTGWGVNENSTLSETLRQAVLPVVSHTNCEKELEDAGYRVTITENMFCAGYKGGSTDTCYGDSGGPVVFADENTKAAKWVLEGIISWGISCGFQNQYGGYTTVSKFLDWIHLYV